MDIDCFEMVRLVEDSGFGFLPEGDLLNQPTMDVVMTMGLRLCALEFSSEQLKLLAYMCLSGVLPESFPHAQWVSAVFRSFSTQEAAICTCVAEWEEIRRMLEQVCTANLTLVSIQGVTLWTRNSVCFPEPQSNDFPLRLLVHPETRDQSHMPDVLHIEATGLGGRDLGHPERWGLSLRSDPGGQQVYGPSLANVEIITVEDDGGGGKSTKHVSALGLTKATNEFLVLHYFAIDSAEAWDGNSPCSFA